MSSSVDVYRHCILEVRYRDLTEILLKSINGSSFPLNFKFGKRGKKGEGICWERRKGTPATRKPLVFMSATTGVRKFMIGCRTMSNLLTCIC